MKADSLEGVYIFTPPSVCEDRRGEMWPWYDAQFSPLMEEGTVARSFKGVVRGIHYDYGRAKYVTCPFGSIWDVAVDLRPDSPTLGDWTATLLSEQNHRSVYLAPGLGHASLSLEDSVVVYLYDTPFDPGSYHALNPLDAQVGIEWPWPQSKMILSEKDRNAPGLEALR